MRVKLRRFPKRRPDGSYDYIVSVTIEGMDMFHCEQCHRGYLVSECVLTEELDVEHRSPPIRAQLLCPKGHWIAYVWDKLELDASSEKES
jgi:hypothetical protein